MVFRRYQSILADCIDAMNLGASVEDCLERYPQQAERLRPALLLASRVSQTPMAPVRPLEGSQTRVSAELECVGRRGRSSKTCPKEELP